MKLGKEPEMEITSIVGCKINCRYCPQNAFLSEYTKKSKDMELSFENFKICIDKIPKEVTIVFAGFSEIFENVKCIDMMQYAYERGHKLQLYTTLTGKGIDIDKFRTDILNIPIDKCVIHIPDEEGYAKIPVTGEYLRLLECVLSAKRKSGERFCNHLFCMGKPHSAIRELIKGYFVLDKIEDRAGNLSCENTDNVHANDYIDESIVCRIHWSYLNKNMLLPDGTVLLCCDDWGMKHILGNLLENSYEEIINGKEHEFVKRSMLLEEENDILCRHCINAVRIGDLPIETWQSEVYRWEMLKE